MLSNVTVTVNAQLKYILLGTLHFWYWKYSLFWSPHKLRPGHTGKWFNMNMHRWRMHENALVEFGLLLCTTAHNIQPSGHPLADSQLGGDGAVNVCECLKLHCPLKRMVFNRCLLYWMNYWGQIPQKKKMHFFSGCRMTFVKICPRPISVMRCNVFQLLNDFSAWLCCF